jgi:hypothetical protein
MRLYRVLFGERTRTEVIAQSKSKYAKAPIGEGLALVWESSMDPFREAQNKPTAAAWRCT